VEKCIFGEAIVRRAVLNAEKEPPFIELTIRIPDPDTRAIDALFTVARANVGRLTFEPLQMRFEIIKSETEVAQ